MSQPSSNREWKFTQVFGDKTSIDNVVEEDIISAISFTPDGKYLAIGDNAGRIVIFEHKALTKATHKFSELSYKIEFQSHFKEFDCLKSVDIEPKINTIEFLPTDRETNFVLSANDKTIKLWKLNDKLIKKVEKPPKRNSTSTNTWALPKVNVVDTGLTPSLKKTYPMLHAHTINSLSRCSNGESFLSADDLCINLWAFSCTNKTYNLVDIAPSTLQEISEVITAAKFDPTQDALFSYSTSKGVIKVCDLRTNSRISSSALHFEDTIGRGAKNFFTDFLSSVCDFTYSKDPNQIFSRTLLSSHSWDKRYPKTPLISTILYEPIQAKLCTLYEKELIFDKFDLKLGANSTYYVTGMYNNCFHICDVSGDKNIQLELNFKKKTIARHISKDNPESYNFEYDVTKRVLKTACHPQNDLIVVASFNCLFVYNST